MDFDFDVQRAFGGDPIAVVNANVLHRVRGAHKEQLERVIDTMGKRSMRAQALHNVLTMASKLRTSDHTLFVVSKRKQCLGIIKVGRKHLFIRNEMGHIKEIEPLCVLDFYVHESCQRHGIGKRLFVYMLEHCRTEPASLGYDRPSHKFLAFLAKHYGLKDYVEQSNNFVVFKQYFATHSGKGRGERSVAPISERPLTSQGRKGGRGAAPEPTHGAGAPAGAGTSMGRGAYGASSAPFGTDDLATGGYARGGSREGGARSRAFDPAPAAGSGYVGPASGYGRAAAASGASAGSSGGYGGYGGASAAAAPSRDTYGSARASSRGEPGFGVGRVGDGAAAADGMAGGSSRVAEGFVPGLGSTSASTYQPSPGVPSGAGASVPPVAAEPGLGYAASHALPRADSHSHMADRDLPPYKQRVRQAPGRYGVDPARSQGPAVDNSPSPPDAGRRYADAAGTAPSTSSYGAAGAVGPYAAPTPDASSASSAAAASGLGRGATFMARPYGPGAGAAYNAAYTGTVPAAPVHGATMHMGTTAPDGVPRYGRRASGGSRGSNGIGAAAEFGASDGAAATYAGHASHPSVAPVTAAATAGFGAATAGPSSAYSDMRYYSPTMLSRPF